jgi:hypothetical protein
MLIVVVFAGCGGGSSSPNPADYKVKIFNGWPQDQNQEQVGGYTESSWHDPAVPKDITITIDSRVADEAGSPAANADLARIQTTQLSGYRERGMKRIKLGGRPTVQWSFDFADESRVDLFFEECGISFLVRGLATPVSFEALSESFREMTSTIKANC